MIICYTESMKYNWIYSICIGTLFFVSGQIFLRKSFTSSDDYIQTLLYFTLAISIMTLVGFLFQGDKTTLHQLTDQRINAFIAGILFFIGFIFWIYTISTKNSLGIIRTFMAGFETLVLFGVGYLFFHEKITLLQSFGVLSILLGIYLIGNGEEH